jgi:hypothetical protein
MFIMENYFGQLSFILFVNMGEGRCKKVRLHTMWCEHGEAHARFAEFRMRNPALPADELCATFVFQTSVD